MALGAQPTCRCQGRAARLVFAERGPWWEGEVNARLLEAVLGASRARGTGRLLLAAMAALADTEGVLEGVSTEELRQAAGLADSGYRRARAALLACGEIVLVEDDGGRGRTNRWWISHPRAVERPATVASQRTAASDESPPRVLAGRVSLPATTGQTEPSVHGTASAVTTSPGGPRRAYVGGTGSAPSAVLGGRGRDLSWVRPEASPQTPPQNPPETPPETLGRTPPETLSPYVRAGREALNPRTQDPPSLPAGGSRGAGRVLVEETYRTARGRQRQRVVAVDIDEALAGLSEPGVADLRDWDVVGRRLAALVGRRVFNVWFRGLWLAAVDHHGALVGVSVEEERAWIVDRFAVALALADAAQHAGRVVRIAEPAQARAIATLRSASPKGAIASPTALVCLQRVLLVCWAVVLGAVLHVC